MPDATGLELIAQAVRERVGDGAVVDTAYYRGEAALQIQPTAVREVLGYLKHDADEPFDFLASLHGLDHYPEEPRLAVHYQLLNRHRVDRLKVATRMGIDDPKVPTVTDLYPGANYPEREVYDFFGVVFEGHPDPRWILMPEDYEGHPQRRDFPIGGEPVLFTFNEHETPRWYE